MKGQTKVGGRAVSGLVSLCLLGKVLFYVVRFLVSWDGSHFWIWQYTWKPFFLSTPLGPVCPFRAWILIDCDLFR